TGAAMSNPQNAASASDATGYFVDMLFRPGPATANAGNQGTVGAATGSPEQQRLDPATRAEIDRIVVRGISQGGLTDDDRGYLAQLISQRTGLPQDEAQRRVSDVENKAKEAADKTVKAGSFVSFWMFMALLFGAVAATIAGIVGGDLRDAELAGRRSALAR